MRHLLGRDLTLRRLYPLLAPLRRRLLAATGWRTLGVRAIVIGADGRIALVQHSYTGAVLYLPGGGVDRGEGFGVALARELREELGIARFAIERVLGVYHARGQGRDDNVVIFIVRLDTPETGAVHVADPREITAVIWADADNPPDAASPATRRRLEEYRRGATGSGIW